MVGVGVVVLVVGLAAEYLRLPDINKSAVYPVRPRCPNLNYRDSLALFGPVIVSAFARLSLPCRAVFFLIFPSPLLFFVSCAPPCFRALT